MRLKPKPCPAGKCDAQIYSVGELRFCIKCGAPNPNYHHTTETTKTPRDKKQPRWDAEQLRAIW